MHGNHGNPDVRIPDHTLEISGFARFANRKDGVERFLPSEIY